MGSRYFPHLQLPVFLFPVARQMLAPSAAFREVATGTALVWAAKENLRASEIRSKDSQQGSDGNNWDLHGYKVI